MKKISINNKSYLGYLNKIVDEYSNTYHNYIGKKPVDADYSVLAEEIEADSKSREFKIGDSVRITKYKNVFSKDYTKNGSKQIFVIDFALKTNLWTYKNKDLDAETIIGSCVINNGCWVIYK